MFNFVWYIWSLLFVPLGVALLVGFLSFRQIHFSRYLKKKVNICFVIAHPDDEVMFFFPSLKLVFNKKKKEEIYMLCLSNGNNYGEGLKREKEFFNVWSYVGGDKKNSKILNIADFQDGFHFWDEKKVFDIVKDFCIEHKIETIITFDAYGISKHPNHISIYRGVKLLRQWNKELLIFTLISTNIIRKYMSVYSCLFLMREKFIVTHFGTRQLLVAMYLYRSQFEYYRVLFCLFSQYAYYNTFQLLNDN